MKKGYYKKWYWLLAIVVVTLPGACKKFLDESPRSAFSTEDVFSTVPDVNKALLGVYSRLAGDQGYGIRLSMYFPVDDDEVQGPTGNPDGDRRDIARYLVNPSNAQIEKPFEQLYAGIERANICIQNIPTMSMYTTGTDQQKKQLQRMYGEALTLRAQFYFELVRNWGDVPAQYLPSIMLKDLFLPRMDRDSIYDHILADLKTAEDLVPWRTEVGSIGDPVNERITKGAVKALRARIALFAGGYSLRVTSRKMERRSNHADYYTIARDECDDIMKRRDQHNLNPDFKALWKNTVCAQKIEDGSGELIFQVAMSGGNSAAGDSKLGYYNGPRVNGQRGNGLFIIPTYFYSFSPYDTRRDVTCVPYSVNADGATKTGLVITSMADGKYRSDWITPAIPPTSNSQYFGLNWIVIRFSDVLLMYAEAVNELNNGPTGAAVAAYEEVRKRAFKGNAGQIGATPTDKAGFFNAIVNERGYEFGDEGIRKYDLIRWNLLDQKITDTKTALANMAGFKPPYANLPASMYYFKNSAADDSTLFANSFYAPAPAATPANTTKITWISSGVSTTSLARYATGFVHNRSELLPLPQVAFDANYNMRPQNPGY